MSQYVSLTSYPFRIEYVSITDVSLLSASSFVTLSVRDISSIFFEHPISKASRSVYYNLLINFFSKSSFDRWWFLKTKRKALRNCNVCRFNFFLWHQFSNSFICFFLSNVLLCIIVGRKIFFTSFHFSFVPFTKWTRTRSDENRCL